MFGERLRILRKQHKLTQMNLAKILGVSGRSVGYYETEERVPPKDIINKMANYFNVSVDYLFGRTNIKDPITKNICDELLEGFHILSEANNLLSKKEKKELVSIVKNYFSEHTISM